MTLDRKKRCNGRMRNTQDMRYARCNKCGRIDMLVNDGDICGKIIRQKKGDQMKAMKRSIFALFLGIVISCGGNPIPNDGGAADNRGVDSKPMDTFAIVPDAQTRCAVGDTADCSTGSTVPGCIIGIRNCVAIDTWSKCKAPAGCE